MIEDLPKNLNNLILYGESISTEFKEAKKLFHQIYLKLFVQCLIEMEDTFF